MTISTTIFFSMRSGKPGSASTTKPFLFRNPQATYHRENSGKLEARPSSDPPLMPARVFLILREIGSGGWISFRSAGCFRNFRVPHSSGCLLFSLSLSLHLSLSFSPQAASATPALIIAPSTPSRKNSFPLPSVHARSVRPLDKAEKPRFSFLTLSKFFRLEKFVRSLLGYFFFFFVKREQVQDICRQLIWKKNFREKMRNNLEIVTCRSFKSF